MSCCIDATKMIEAIKSFSTSVKNPCDDATAQLVKEMLFHYCEKVSNEFKEMSGEEGDIEKRMNDACIKAFMIKTTDTDGQTEEDFLEIGDLARHAKANGDRQLRKTDTRAGLLFPVEDISKHFSSLCGDITLSDSSSIYITAVVEYLSTEILEIGGGVGKSFMKKNNTLRSGNGSLAKKQLNNVSSFMKPSDFKLGIENDEELNYCFKDFNFIKHIATIESSGNNTKNIPLTCDEDEDSLFDYDSNIPTKFNDGTALADYFSEDSSLWELIELEGPKNADALLFIHSLIVYITRKLSENIEEGKKSDIKCIEESLKSIVAGEIADYAIKECEKVMTKFKSLVKSDESNANDSKTLSSMAGIHVDFPICELADYISKLDDSGEIISEEASVYYAAFIDYFIVEIFDLSKWKALDRIQKIVGEEPDDCPYLTIRDVIHSIDEDNDLRKTLECCPSYKNSSLTWKKKLLPIKLLWKEMSENLIKTGNALMMKEYYFNNNNQFSEYIKQNPEGLDFVQDLLVHLIDLMSTDINTDENHRSVIEKNIKSIFTGDLLTKVLTEGKIALRYSETEGDSDVMTRAGLYFPINHISSYIFNNNGIKISQDACIFISSTLESITMEIYDLSEMRRECENSFTVAKIDGYDDVENFEDTAMGHLYKKHVILACMGDSNLRNVFENIPVFERAVADLTMKVIDEEQGYYTRFKTRLEKRREKRENKKMNKGVQDLLRALGGSGSLLSNDYFPREDRGDDEDDSDDGSDDD